MGPVMLLLAENHPEWFFLKMDLPKIGLAHSVLVSVTYVNPRKRVSGNCEAFMFDISC